MRDLDAKQLITSDFLLVSGDVVSSLPLHHIIQQHKQRRQVDKNAIMTMILRQSHINHRTKYSNPYNLLVRLQVLILAPRCQEELGVFCIDSKTNRCVYYEEMTPHAVKKNISIPPELFKRHPTIEVRADLIDCAIDICSPDVPALFTENFDYQHIRRHFVHGILEDYELYGKTIHCHVATDLYAARVRSLRTYDSVSKDIIENYAYPYNPGNSIFSGHRYHYQRGNIYKGDGVVLGRGCIIKPNTVIGERTHIGEGSVVGASVIGNNCKIGKNVVIEGAYIWDSVVIEDACKVTDSIIAEKVFLGSGSIVEDTSVISYNVILSSGTTVTAHKRLTNCKRARSSDDESDEEKEEGETQEEDVIVGETDVSAEHDPILYMDSESEDEDATKVIDSLGKSMYSPPTPWNTVSHTIRKLLD